MKDQNSPNRPRSRVKTNSKYTLAFILFLTLAGVLAGGILFLMREKPSDIRQIFYSIEKFFSSGDLPNVTNNPKFESKILQSDQAISSDSQLQNHSSDHVTDSKELPSLPKNNNDSIRTDPLSSETALANKQSVPPPKTDNYQKCVDDLNSFYAHLDQQTYMQEFHLKESSKKHFSKLLQILINNPPVITRETDDYFNLLKNTAHFYRILGKDNILILKGILDREKVSFEHILKSFYALTDHPEYLKNEFSLVIPKENLYDYAAFFLNTIGGRLYLFRRDSTSRMAISYYAVLIVDKANREGNSPQGIDLRPAIDSLIEEIENTGKSLKLKEEYLDTLYDLKEYYGNRG